MASSPICRGDDVVGVGRHTRRRRASGPGPGVRARFRLSYVSAIVSGGREKRYELKLWLGSFWNTLFLLLSSLSLSLSLSLWLLLLLLVVVVVVVWLQDVSFGTFNVRFCCSANMLLNAFDAFGVFHVRPFAVVGEKDLHRIIVRHRCATVSKSLKTPAPHHGTRPKNHPQSH